MKISFKKTTFLWVLAIEITRRVGRFVLIPIIAKQYGPIEYGIWTQIGVTVEILTIFAGLDLKSAIPIFLPGKPKSEQKDNFWSSFSISLLSGIIIGGITCIFSGHLATLFFGGIHNKLYVMLGCLLMVINIAYNFLFSLFRTLLYLKISFLLLFTELILSVFLFIGASFLNQKLVIIIFLKIAIHFILFLLSTFFVIKKLGITIPYFKNIITMLKYCLPLIPTMALHWIYNSSDRYLLSYLGYFNDLGKYAIGYTIGYFPIGFIFALVFYLIPGIVVKLWNQGKNELALENMNIFMKYSSIASLFFLGIIYILKGTLIKILSSDAFLDASSVILPIGLGYIILYIGDFYMSTLSMLKKTYFFPLVYSVPALTNIILNLLWIPRWGISGAAYATLFSMSILSLLNFLVCNKTLKTNYPLKTVFLAFFLTAFSIFLSKRIGFFESFSHIFTLVTFTLTFLSGCFIFRIFDINEIKRMVIQKN